MRFDKVHYPWRGISNLNNWNHSRLSVFQRINETIMAGLEIIAAEGGSALKDFIDLPWEIYAQYPKWVPPLKKDVRRLLDPRRHPFWEFSERRLFLARRGAQDGGQDRGHHRPPL